MHIITTRPPPRFAGLVLVLGSISACAALTIDMYLPAMPGMAADLDTRAGMVQLTLTTFIVGLAVGQIVVGPLSDAVGRRGPLLTGLATYAAASVACALAPSVDWLIAARVAQALGAAAATVLSRAIVRDLFSGAAMTRFFSTLMLVNGVAPVVAPVIGAQLLLVGSWRVVFLVLAGVGMVLFVVAAAALPESLPVERRAPAQLWSNVTTLGTLVRDVLFLRYAMTAALMFAAMFAYIAGSSFVLQDVHGLTPQQFSLVFAANGLGIVVVGQVNAVLVGRVATEHTLLLAGLVVAAVAGVGVLLCTVAELPLVPLLGCLFAVVSMLGIVLANATSLALEPHGAAAGAASSLTGLLQFLVAGLAASAMGLAGAGSAVPMGVTVCVCTVAALAVYLVLRPGVLTSASPPAAEPLATVPVPV